MLSYKCLRLANISPYSDIKCEAKYLEYYVMSLYKYLVKHDVVKKRM